MVQRVCEALRLKRVRDDLMRKVKYPIGDTRYLSTNLRESVDKFIPI